MNILDYNSLEIRDIRFEDPEKVKASYMCFAKYNEDEIVIQTPMLRNFEGIHETETRALIDLYFEKTHLDFYNFMSDLDDYNVEKIHKTSSDWFSKEIGMDLIEDLYLTPLKHKNPPRLKLKLPMSKGKVDVPIFDIDDKPIKSTDVPKDSKIIALLRFDGIKFLKEQVLCEWVPIQLKVCQKVDVQYDSLINIENDEIEAEEVEGSEEEEEESLDENEEETELTLDLEEIPDEEIKKSIEEELHILKSKYSEKEDELIKLKSALKNFIDN